MEREGGEGDREAPLAPAWDLPRHGAPAQAGSAQKIGRLPLLTLPYFLPLPLPPFPFGPPPPHHSVPAMSRCSGPPMASL